MELSTSKELRKWFDHKEEHFEEFSKKYRIELKDHSELVEKLQNRGKEKPHTLLYGTKDEEHNQALVLKDFIEGIYLFYFEAFFLFLIC